MIQRFSKDKFQYKDEISELIEKDGHLTKNDMKAAGTLNNYFESVFTKENPINLEIDCRETSQLPTINIEVLERHLTYVNQAKSTRMTDLPLLWRTAKPITDPLAKVLCRSPN